MASLLREYRRQLERVIIEARRVGEKGAINALKALAVDHHEPLGGMPKTQRDLRNRLRAHGRQLGDQLDKQRGTQGIRHLATECAYEQWHRMLFARFLAENNLLIEPESGVALSLDDCRELAREKNTDWVELASSFAVQMLPQIFRVGDPVLEVALPPETHGQLEELLESLPTEVFAADDSLGWVYQFWQSELKDQVNASGEKIGADELPAVTQLFTEDYMVLFLLHNTLGAWWTAKRKSEGKEAKLPGYEWTYLRLTDDGSPAAGAFEGWPKLARDIKVLDPSMGSGHFLTFALPILVAFRTEEEGISREDAVKAVLRDNLFGLEIDNRCTQIAAFNLAVSAWRIVGYQSLPAMNLACSGLSINAREQDWLELAGKDSRVEETMRRLYHLFEQAPVLGSLIDPTRVGGTLFTSEFQEVRHLLLGALSSKQEEDTVNELAVTARGIVKAAEILSQTFTLVATNVPYLGRGKQVEELKTFCDANHSQAKADLATSFVDRCLRLCEAGGTTAVVTPQAWLYLGVYRKWRDTLLRNLTWCFVVRLGSRAFETISGEVVNVGLFVLSRALPPRKQAFAALDVTTETGLAKAKGIISKLFEIVQQRTQLDNPDTRVLLHEATNLRNLGTYAFTTEGISTGDLPRIRRAFWEAPSIEKGWKEFMSSPEEKGLYVGRSFVIPWFDGEGPMRDVPGSRYIGLQAWSRKGVLIRQMSSLPVTLYTGEPFDDNTAVIIPGSEADLAALWTFSSSTEFPIEVRKVDQSLKVTSRAFSTIPFDLARWRSEAAKLYPKGLPHPSSTSPEQWLFAGHPAHADSPLQVAVARLIGYRWPRQTGSKFTDCAPIEADGLEVHADSDGVVPLAAIKGARTAADRVRALLADAYGKQWSATRLSEVLTHEGYGGEGLEDWLRDGFFNKHCELFHQHPFVWHVWDGLNDGFSALVNYHKLAGRRGEGKRTLEKLIYTYLGDWIDRQRADQKNGVEGSDAKLAAAEHLQKELEKILKGEPPYDIFVRWKPLHEQSIGWEPDINDGVRINIRPFMTAKVLNGRGKSTCILRSTPKIKWDKDRGKEPHRPKEEFPWFWSWDGSTEDFAGGREFDGNRWNDLHYSIQKKHEARERQKGKKK